MYRMVFIEVLRSVIRIAGTAGLLCCFSCTAYREVVFETVVPSAYTLEEGRKIGFLDRKSYKPAEDTSISLNGTVLGVGSGQMANVFRDGFYTRYAETYPMDTLPVAVAEEMKQRDRDSAVEVLSPLDVVLVCRKYGLNYLLSWESFQYTLSRGGKSVDGNFRIRFYSGKDGQVVSSQQLQEEFFDCLYEFGGGGGGFYEESAAIVNCMKGKMWDRGYLYAQEWLPDWRKTVRRMYVSPRVLGVGDFYYRLESKDQAYGIWSAATSGKPDVALRAYLNLALMYELDEEFEIALSFLQEAQKVSEQVDSKDAEYLENYVRELEERIKNRPAAEQQLF